MSNYRKRKGDQGEAVVKATLEANGLIVRNGAGSESGADLFVFTSTGQLLHEAEVKRRKEGTVNGLQGDEKRALARRAKANRAIGWDYRLYFICDLQPRVAQIYTVGELLPSEKRQGLHLRLFEAGYLNLLYAVGLPLGVRQPAPKPSSAESRAAAEPLRAKDASRAESIRPVSAPVVDTARPAMPERQHRAWCPGDEPESEYCMSKRSEWR